MVLLIHHCCRSTLADQSGNFNFVWSLRTITVGLNPIWINFE
ncbi:hypothetical protein RchiOBHm_Chr6g0247351 [Rosa chinensis]|uniref:Uncharacterized protein n=1 Tax=Rosa chinensis TaxID=74649 RepID=A0A2P6PJR2_ROSCH|nr:hypothetical protein RchiOBHm_Chr6g0247351 [Rosa chinensis]